MLVKFALIVSVMYINPNLDPSAVVTTSLKDVYGPWDSEEQCHTIAESLLETAEMNLDKAGLQFIDAEHSCGKVETRKPVSVFIEQGAIIG